MLIRPTIILLAVLATGGSAAAQEMCSDLPIAPDILAPKEMSARPPMDANTAMRGAFSELKHWQGDLKSYRDCLTATINTDTRMISEQQHSDKPDPDKIAKMQAELKNVNDKWNASVDDEERVVNQFHAAQTAYCARSDVNRAVCPKT